MHKKSYITHKRNISFNPLAFHLIKPVDLSDFASQQTAPTRKRLRILSHIAKIKRNALRKPSNSVVSLNSTNHVPISTHKSLYSAYYVLPPIAKERKLSPLILNNRRRLLPCIEKCRNKSQCSYEGVKEPNILSKYLKDLFYKYKMQQLSKNESYKKTEQTADSIVITTPYLNCNFRKLNYVGAKLKGDDYDEDKINVCTSVLDSSPTSTTPM